MYNLKHFLNNSRKAAVIGTAAAAVALAAFTAKAEAAETPLNGWDESGHWYENGVKQGTQGRGKEIYDPSSDAWYWLDSIQGGAVAKSKDVYQESWAGSYADRPDGTGKWVRYDENGHMVKGWDTNEDGKYYFEPVTGAMAKGTVNIDGTSYRFDNVTGILLDNVFVNDNGCEYWYEGGIKQGTEGRGKEIYDPETDAWYWLDAIDNGKKATAKDVYQEAGNKWVRYDANGRMLKGWQTNENGNYYFDLVTGAMAKGTVFIDNYEYVFDDITGIYIGATGIHMQTKYIYYHNMDGSLYATDSITYRAYEDGTPVEERLYTYDDTSRVMDTFPKSDNPNILIMCWLIKDAPGPVVDNIEYRFECLNVADYPGDIHMYPGYLGGN